MMRTMVMMMTMLIIMTMVMMIANVIRALLPTVSVSYGWRS